MKPNTVWTWGWDRDENVVYHYFVIGDDDDSTDTHEATASEDS